jgi:hypothetical protein
MQRKSVVYGTLYISNAATPYGGISKYSISCKVIGFLRIAEEYTVRMSCKVPIRISEEKIQYLLQDIGVSHPK